MNHSFNQRPWHEQTIRLLEYAWINQPAFIRSIRPELQNGHRYISQSVIGGVLVAILLASVTGGLITMLGVGISWTGLGILLSLSLIGLLLTFRGERSKQVPYYVIFAPIIGVAAVLVMAAYAYTLNHEQEFIALDTTVLSLTMGFVIGFGMLHGIGLGLGSALKEGRINRQYSMNQLQIAFMGVIVGGVIIYVLGPNRTNYPLGLLLLPMNQLGVGLGNLCGGRWALRHQSDPLYQAQIDAMLPNETTSLFDNDHHLS